MGAVVALKSVNMPDGFLKRPCDTARIPNHPDIQAQEPEKPAMLHHTAATHHLTERRFEPGLRVARAPGAPPFSPPFGPDQRLFQEPPGNFLAALAPAIAALLVSPAFAIEAPPDGAPPAAEVAPAPAAPEINKALQDLPKRMRDAIEAGPGQREQKPGANRTNQGATVSVRGDWGSIEFKSVDGGKEITARDPQGKVVWTGPWDTEQDKAGAPEDVRQRVERLNFEGRPPFPRPPVRPPTFSTAFTPKANSLAPAKALRDGDGARKPKQLTERRT